MYCRDLTKKFDDVFVISGPVMKPTLDSDGKKVVTYPVSTEIIRFVTIFYHVYISRSSVRTKSRFQLISSRSC